MKLTKKEKIEIEKWVKKNFLKNQYFRKRKK